MLFIFSPFAAVIYQRPALGITTGGGGASSRGGVARNASRDLDDGGREGGPGKHRPNFSPISLTRLSVTSPFVSEIVASFFYLFIFSLSCQNFFFCPSLSDATAAALARGDTVTNGARGRPASPATRQERLNDNRSRGRKRIRWTSPCRMLKRDALARQIARPCACLCEIQ